MNRRDFFSALGAAGVVGHLGRYTTHAQHLGDFKVDSPELQGSAHRAVWGRNGVVAAADQHASLAGVRMLMKGGNAIDAIVAAAAALNVAEPSMSGMGGFGGYMVVYLAAERKVVALDMMGLSSSAATADKFTEQDFDEGYKAPVVPGTIGGWAEALSRYGTMSLGDVFEPAIELAERGFVVTKYDALSFAAEANKLKKFPTTARIFFPDGKPPREGQVVKQPDLARSFRRIAIEGVDAFYHGELGEEIVAFLQENGGLLNKQDFASFQPRWREPIQTTFKGHTLYGMGPGSCEMTMFQVLNIMEGFDLESMTPYSSQFAHLWLEAVKLAFLDDDRYNTGKDVDIPGQPTDLEGVRESAAVQDPSDQRQCIPRPATADRRHDVAVGRGPLGQRGGLHAVPGQQFWKRGDRRQHGHLPEQRPPLRLHAREESCECGGRRGTSQGRHVSDDRHARRQGTHGYRCRRRLHDPADGGAVDREGAPVRHGHPAGDRLAAHAGQPGRACACRQRGGNLRRARVPQERRG
jgi:hypothetical protein